jgi:glutathione S-transferase
MSALQKRGNYDKVFALKERVAANDKIKSYLQSERRQPYSMGIFRHYPELDGDD